MQVGTLVRWTTEGEDFGCLGVVIESDDDDGECDWFVVHWTDGQLEEYDKASSHWKQMEISCK